MNMHGSPRAAARRGALVLALPLLAACAERSAPPTVVEVPKGPAALLAALTCTADVPRSTLACAEAAPAAGGVRADQRVVGGQGTYIRVATSGVSYAGGVFSFNLTVQNLSNLAMATADGSTRDDGGVKVFFHTPPAGAGGSITVNNSTGTGTFTAPGQHYFQYGGQIGGVDQGELGAEGVLASAETSSPKNWQLGVPAGVATFSFVVYVSTTTASGTLSTVAPQVSGTSAATLVPGSSVTLTGTNFSATPASNTVTIGGAAATVTAATPTSLTVTVPCVATGTAQVQVTTGGMKGVAVDRPLQANQRTVGLGQAVVVTDAAEVGCNELVPSGASSTYVVAVYNTSTTPTSSTGFRFSADGAALAPATRPTAARGRSVAPFGGPAASVVPAQVSQEERWHARIMEMNRRENERLRARFARDPRMRPNVVNADPVAPPATRTIRVVDLNGSTCGAYTSVNATRVYYNGKIAIYEDDNTPAAFKAASNATMQAYYNQIGDQFNADMEPVVRTNFGDPLRRDATTDNNGVLVALFTPLLNNNYPGVAGFVTSCDQYPNAAGNESSNFGEYFYAYQPTATGTGYATFTADSWYRSIRATFIHETKHVASQAARVANGASLEQSWLEEGTARHAEELWARTSVYGVAWKANTGYGSSGSPGSIYCDVRTTAACTASNPRRPSLNMYRHFDALYTFMQSPELYSPFGRSSYDGSLFYAISWSLVRYTIDRYGASDAAFLSGLNESSTTGAANLAAQAGVSIEQLMGGWALALYADDYPGLASPSADLQMPTWNFDSIFAGLSADFPSTYTSVYPLQPSAYALGTMSPVSVPELVGGGVSYYLLSGTHTQAQLVRLESTTGGAPASSLRVAIARVQ